MRNSDGAERVRRFLRAERKRHGWSQSDVALRAHVARNTVAALEQGMALREGNEGAIEEALGLELGTIEDVRRGRYSPDEAPVTDRQDQRADSGPSPGGLSERERQLLVELDERDWSPKEIAEALDVLRRGRRGTPTVEQQQETDRAQSELSLPQLGETGTE